MTTPAIFERSRHSHDPQTSHLHNLHSDEDEMDGDDEDVHEDGEEDSHDPQTFAQ